MQVYVHLLQAVDNDINSLKKETEAMKVERPYHNLRDNSSGLYSSRPWIIASGCTANIVINTAACI